MKSFFHRLLALVVVTAAFSSFGVAAFAQTTPSESTMEAKEKSEMMEKDAMAEKEAMMEKDAMAEKEAMMEKDAMAEKEAMMKEEVKVIDLTQTPGVFTTESLTLAPGKYRFVVANDGVDHEVGFVIQRAEDADGNVMETAVENSFTESTIADGKTASTGVVTLTPGEYVYSCPLNPPPHYTITVK